MRVISFCNYWIFPFKSFLKFKHYNVMKIFKTLLFSFASLLFVTPAMAQLKVIANGNVGVGTSNPGTSLEVIGTFLLSNNSTASTSKQSNMLMRTFANGDNFFNFMTGQASANNNLMIFGGGNGGQLAATAIVFNTTNSVSAVGAGTERMRINSAGKIRLNTAGGSGALSHEFNLITGNASKPGGGDWATPSDARIKKGVRPFTDGLEQVMEIEPVFFSYKENTGYPSTTEYVGIIAQDMQKIAPYTIEEVAINQDPEEARLDLPETLLTYNGTAVTYMLVNAIQEQQAIIENLESRLEKLERMIVLNGNSTLNGNSAVTTVTLEGTDVATLKQNAPNPFSENTTIEYTLPRSNFNSAFIQISNVQGAVMRVVNLPKEGGPGVLQIKAKELPAGEYAYTLVLDGRVIDTKKMLIIGN
jgi:hypothetical protein